MRHVLPFPCQAPLCLVLAIISYFTVVLQAVAEATESKPEPNKPNVVLILVDDLKPILGCYGDRLAVSPNIDRLAAKSLRFDLAYCNQAVCAASRCSLLLGSHPTSSGLYGLGNRIRNRIPNAVTLPQHFEVHGYRVEGLGKLFHVGHGNNGDPESFKAFYHKDLVVEYLDPASTHGGQLTREEALFTNQELGRIPSLPRGAAWEQPDVRDESYADGRVAAKTIERLQLANENRNTSGQPFFIAAGFVRPHLPFSAPQKYWDLYKPEDFVVPENEPLPIDAPKAAGKRGGEIAAYDPVPTGPNAQFSDDLKRNLIHGYYASMSYMDAQVGKILDEMERLNLFENTIVVFWSDHGYHLGDHGIWTKHTNYEQANRIPLLIYAPKLTSPGTSTKQLAESVDIYPTLSELAGLPEHTGPQHIDGKSLVRVLRDPDARIRDHAYHMFPNAKMGRAIRTERYRLVEWKNHRDPSQLIEYELYDYETDPTESRNLIDDLPEIATALQSILATYPPPVIPGSLANLRTP